MTIDYIHAPHPNNWDVYKSAFLENIQPDLMDKSKAETATASQAGDSDSVISEGDQKKLQVIPKEGRSESRREEEGCREKKRSV